MDEAVLRADLHAHTDASFDCHTTVRQLLRSAQKAGLHAIAVTDHDSVASQALAMQLAPRYGLQVIPGVEITAIDGTHVVGYFISESPKNLSPLEIIQFIKEKGGVSCLPHPYRSDTGLIYNHREKGLFTKKEVDQVLAAVDLLEAVNFKSVVRGEPGVSEIIAEYPKPLVASTDGHYDLEIGKAFTAFQVPSSTPVTPTLLKHCKRELWIHPVPDQLVKPATSLPLANYEPKEATVSALKKVIPGPIIPTLGKALYRWQRMSRYRAKTQQMNTLLTHSPKAQPYTV